MCVFVSGFLTVLQNEDLLYQNFDRLLDYVSDHTHQDSIIQELALEEVRKGGGGEESRRRGDEAREGR